MHKLFIKNNIKQIRNPEDVNIVATRQKDIGNGNLVYFLIAFMADGSKIPLTYEVSRSEYFDYDYEAFEKCMGEYFTDSFYSILTYQNAFVNLNNLIEVKSVMSEDKTVTSEIFFSKNALGITPSIKLRTPVKLKEFKKSFERLEYLYEKFNGQKLKSTFVDNKAQTNKQNLSKNIDLGEDEEELPSIDEDYYKD